MFYCFFRLKLLFLNGKYIVGMFFIIAYYLIQDYLCKIKIDQSFAEQSACISSIYTEPH